jgi:hypothetical protein
MHLIARGTEPCGLEDGHGGRHRTVAGAAREAARRTSTAYYDQVARWKNAHPAAYYLHRMRSHRRAREVAA